MIDTAQSLKDYCRENGRVCPQPRKWQELFSMLPERRQIGAGWEPSVPLILGAWNFASNLEKMLRLAEHIQWADDHGELAEASAFLRSLEETDWHHLSD